MTCTRLNRFWKRFTTLFPLGLLLMTTPFIVSCFASEPEQTKLTAQNDDAFKDDEFDDEDFEEEESIEEEIDEEENASKPAKEPVADKATETEKKKAAKAVAEKKAVEEDEENEIIDDEEEEEIATEEEEPVNSQEEAEDTTASEQSNDDESDESDETLADDTEASQSPVTIKVPAVMTKHYNEANPRVVLKWSPAGNYTLLLSRTSTFTYSSYRRKITNGDRASFSNLYPGDWYWRIVDRKGNKSPAYKIIVKPADKLSLSFDAVNMAIKVKAGRIYWRSNKNSAYYRFEVAHTAKFATPIHTARTEKTDVSVATLPKGSYMARLSGFNKSKGKWERSKIYTLVIE